MVRKSQKSDVDYVIESWVKEQLEEGENPEIIKESLIILNRDPRIVDKILKSVKPKKKELKKEVKKDVLSVPAGNVIEQEHVRINIPHELLPQDEDLFTLEHKKPISDLKIKEIAIKKKFKSIFPLVLMLIGASLILIGVYIYFYL